MVRIPVPSPEADVAVVLAPQSFGPSTSLILELGPDFFDIVVDGADALLAIAAALVERAQEIHAQEVAAL
jgi:hypothetical protein